MATSNVRFLIVKPENGGICDLVRFLVRGDKQSSAKFLEYSEVLFEEETELQRDGDDGEDEVGDHRWVIFVSILVRKILKVFEKPMEWSGYFLEFFLNLFSLNGSFLGLLYNMLHGKVVIPQRGSETFISSIGHVDGRINLYKNAILTKEIARPDLGDKNMQLGMGHRALMDLCMMSSKLAYENENVLRDVVNHHWKMHFVDFYNCWNDYEKESSTQVFILCDKPKDANLILISFRGTEPFDADDWITDFDYSWYEIPKLGKVHMGFLEALGLGNRGNTSTFHEQLFVKNAKSIDSEQPPERSTAYYTVRSKLKSLLNEHDNAKFVVTGHSLGGALAILFPTMLVMHEETDVMKRLLGVYTYGQPRIGNRQLGKFMEAHLEHPVPKYFRVVYSNDLVPRLPYDDKTFLYKHFGICMYYNSLYIEQKVDEEPNMNFFGLRFVLPVYLNAGWEFIRSFTMGYIYGTEYKESWESVLLRMVGLVFPGISAHSPVDYVNSVRLGRERSIQMSSF
ncbi:triacylglycerol lipase OBL1 [Lycium barbarum]|uniref:triacylglycerol lipase OBL1 n=1 Tax=Lycium barbarum TaxID=112863 RepID=UPI00293F1BD8|nr:triacylglycerol lipase OBL1 [Lycium barbarum]